MRVGGKGYEWGARPVREPPDRDPEPRRSCCKDDLPRSPGQGIRLGEPKSDWKWHGGGRGVPLDSRLLSKISRRTGW